MLLYNWPLTYLLRLTILSILRSHAFLLEYFPHQTQILGCCLGHTFDCASQHLEHLMLYNIFVIINMVDGILWPCQSLPPLCRHPYWRVSLLFFV